MLTKKVQVSPQPIDHANQIRVDEGVERFQHPETVGTLAIRGGVKEISGNAADDLNLKLISMLKMFEPIEFYEIRQISDPKAPSKVRILSSVVIIAIMLALFIYVALTSSNSFAFETDLYRTVTDDIASQWDSCVPITTLGSTYTPFVMTFADDCFKRLQINAYKVFFPSVKECVSKLAPNMKLFCRTFERNGWMIQKMTGMTLFTKNVSVGFDSYSYDGNFIVPKSLKYPLTVAVPNCTENFLHLVFDYLEPTTYQWETECFEAIPKLCSAIYASSNPYKCTKKVKTGIVDALSNAYAFTTLIFSVGAVVVASFFSFLFRSQQKAIEK